MEQQKFTTEENKHEIVANKYLTGEQLEELRDILLADDDEVKLDNAGQATRKINKELLTKVDKRQTEMVIISVDGKTDNVFQAIRELEAPDYFEIKEFIESKTKKKQKS